jgi:hypothetical protein
MPHPTVKRADVIEITRRALPPEMIAADAAALMQVAETSTFLATGTYRATDEETNLQVGCPLNQAFGLNGDYGGDMVPGEGGFIGYFDEALADLLGERSETSIVQVIA